MKLIVITGVSSGLGKCLAELIDGTEDTFLMCLGRKSYKAHEVDEHNVFIRWDLRTPRNIECLDFGLHLDVDKVSEVIFINNAAQIDPLGDIEKANIGKIIDSVAVNITSPMLLLRRIMGMGKKTSVINITSGAAIKPISGWSTYCAGKSGVRMFLDVMAEDGMAVYHIDPGVMDTPMQQKIKKESEYELVSPKSVAKFIVESMKGWGFLK